MESLITIKSMSKQFGDKPLLKNISFEIKKGDILGIFGASGVGKTTLLNLLIGFFGPTAGEVLYKNQKVQNNCLVRKSFGFASQSGSFYPELTVVGNLLYFGKLYDLKSVDLERRAKKILQLVKLNDAKNILAKNLSSGMQRRLDIACSLINKPEVLILDEPTANLDPNLRKKILGLIKKLNSLGTTVILTSQIIDETERICSKAILLHNGRIIKSGNLEQIKNAGREEVCLKTMPGNYKKIIKKLKKLKINAFEKENKLVIPFDGAKIKLQNIMVFLKRMGERLIELKVSEPSMQKFFEDTAK